jgi:hypothetical protein
MKMSKEFNNDFKNIAQILGILNNTFKPTLAQKSSRIKVYKTLAVPILLYGSEIWTLRQKNKKLVTSIQMKVFKPSAGYTLLTTQRMKKFLKS